MATSDTGANCTIKKLSGVDNFVLWQTQMMLILKTKRLSSIVTGAKPTPPTTKADKCLLWLEKDASASGEIGLYLQDDLVCYHVKTSGQTAKALWDLLNKVYNKQDTDSL